VPTPTGPPRKDWHNRPHDTVNPEISGLILVAAMTASCCRPCAPVSAFDGRSGTVTPEDGQCAV